MMMLFLSTIGLLATSVIAGGPYAYEYCDKISYVQFTGPVCGTIVFKQDGTGPVTVETLGDGIYFSDPSLGPFPYHVHLLPVPTDGNCTGAGPHLDPFNVTEAVVCDPSTPNKCQVGDLSGKHGKMSGSLASFHYVDDFLSLMPGNVSFIGGRSVVIHKSDLTRYVCANITEVTDGKGIPDLKCPCPSETGTAPSMTATATYMPSISMTSTTTVCSEVTTQIVPAPSGYASSVYYPPNRSYSSNSSYTTPTPTPVTSAPASTLPVFTSAAVRDTVQTGIYLFVACAGLLLLLQ